jgi:tetratricopeptide (TPR) repeat protein
LKLKDQLPEAISEVQEALRLNPAMPDAHYTLAIIRWQQGDFPAAAEQLRAAIAAKADYVEAYYTLGTVLKQMNQLPDAAEALRHAIKLQPDLVGAHTTLATVLQQQGNTEGAAAERRAAAEISKTNTSLQAARFNTNSGSRLMTVGDLDGAIAQFEAAIKLSPAYAPAHYQLSLALRRKGQSARADEEAKKAIELDPRIAPVQSQ